MPKAPKRTFYVYVIERDGVPLYAGKGVDSRGARSARRHGGVCRVLEEMTCERKAFAAERKWIAELLPPENRNKGGAGGRATVYVEVPPSFRGVLSRTAFLKQLERDARERAEIKRIGSQRYVARQLLALCPAAIPPSKLDAIRQVAHG